MKRDELIDALLACRGYFVPAALFSLAVNLLYLASPIYMLQIYDRVVTSGSVTTLVMLSLVLLFALAVLASLDFVRSRILARAGLRLDRLLTPRILAATSRQTSASAARSQPLRDFDNFRQVITGAGIHAVFDLPWAPIYIGVIFLLHPALGWFALGSAAVLAALAVTNEWLVRKKLAEANEGASRNYAFIEMALRNADVVQTMGMLEGLTHRWQKGRGDVLDKQLDASDRAAVVSSIIRFLRLAMQSIILGLGAYLVIEGMISVGSIFAASLLLGRALQPVEQLVGSWRNLVSARTSANRLRTLLAANPEPDDTIKLPRPKGRLSVETLSYSPPGNRQNFVLRGVSFQLSPGDALGIIGPSGAGKSTLARHLIGALAPTFGTARLDGADVAAWPAADLGQYVGYLPQDIELIDDTVAANISRFQGKRDDEIIDAAKLAGVHEMILKLPDGYRTKVGECVLSAGYRQRIALARAVFGRPSLVVLDEPTSNLDSDGDIAFSDCIRELKKSGTTVVIVSHRPSTLDEANKILILQNGTVTKFGDRTSFFEQPSEPAAIRGGQQQLGAVAAARG